jgi:hypothetical protein
LINPEKIINAIKQALGLIEKPKTRLYDEDHFTVSESKFKMLGTMLPVVLVDPTGPDIPQYIELADLKVAMRHQIPTLLLNETLTWTGTAGVKDSAWIDLNDYGGFQFINLLLSQIWTTAPTGAVLPYINATSDDGTTKFVVRAGVTNLINVTTGNGVKQWVNMICSTTDGTRYSGTDMPVPCDIMQVRINAAGGSPAGTVELWAFGV